MKNIACVFLIVSLCQVAFGQGELDEQEKILYQNERSISLSLNTNGFGAGYRYGKRLTYLNKMLYDIEVAYVKHPKEAKVSSQISGFNTRRRFIPGKLNLLVNIRPSIGFQREVFSKEDKGSVAVKYYFSGGPSVGITKPIYYSYAIVDNSGRFILYYIDEKYTTTLPHSFWGIAGKSSFWKGFDELSVYPGLHAKAGLSFEYGTSNRIIKAIDVGATLDAFFKEIPIMLNTKNNRFFFTLSASYRFGWIMDTKYKGSTKRGVEDLLNY